MRTLITGAAGMLGQEVRGACARAGHEVVALARSELDIADSAAVQTAIAHARPDVVVNCAGWTDVDGAQLSEALALRANATGAGRVAAAAAAHGAWTLHISSDYVFDGRKSTPYVESDPVGPLSAYGRTKLAGELEVARAAPHAHTIVRSSWLFGAGGQCFPKTIMRLAAEGEAIGVVADQVGCPTFTGHLAQALAQLAVERIIGVLHVAGSGCCSWFDFAREIVFAAGSDCEVRPIATEQYPLPARRPAYSVLGTERAAPALPDWRQGLRDFGSQLKLVAA
jgi:dTDP-4-dehydrorhamnose reductase